MEIFISWSGELSEKIADAIKCWLPSVIQAIKPFYSPKDISKGQNWNAELNRRLKSARLGLVIVTPDSKNSPWLLFEAGAISNKFDDALVCAILFNMSIPDLTGPLTQFQITTYQKADFHKLIGTINDVLAETKLEKEVLDNAFEIFWPKLENEIKSIFDSHQTKSAKVTIRPDRELLEEILKLCRQSNQFPNSQTLQKLVNSEATEVVRFDEFHQSIILNTLSHGDYPIGLDQLNSGADIVDFIFQIARKGWVTPGHIYQFVKLIEVLSLEAFGENAQGVFCPSGQHKMIDWPSVVLN